MSDEDLPDWAKSVSTTEDLPDWAKAVKTDAPEPKKKVTAPPPEDKSTFGERVGKEWNSFKTKAGKVIDDLRKPVDLFPVGKPGSRPLPAANGTAPLAPGEEGPGLKNAFHLREGLGATTDALLGMGEVPLSMASKGAAGVAGGIAGAGRVAGGLAMGEDADKALDSGARLNAKISSFGYEPKTVMGKTADALIQAPMRMASDVTKSVGGTVGRVLGNEAAGETIGESAPAAAAAVLGAKSLADATPALKARGALTQEQEAISKAQDAGYRANPARVNPTLVNKFVQSVAGGDGDKKAAFKNQVDVNTDARKMFGLDKNEDLSPITFDGIREKAGAAYQDIKDSNVEVKMDSTFRRGVEDLDKGVRAVKNDFPGLYSNPELEKLRTSLDVDKVTPAGVIGAVKQLRSDATINFRSENPDKVALAFAQREAAGLLDDVLERNLRDSGLGAKADSYAEARKTIAASHDLESSTNPVTGNVNPQALGRLLAKGRPLSGELRQIAEAAKAMPTTMKDTSKMQEPGLFHTGDLGFAYLLSRVAREPALVAASVARPLASTVASSRAYQGLAGRPKGPRTGQIPMRAAGGAAASQYGPQEEDNQ